MTSNNLISPMKFCHNTNSTLPKQCQSSRSVLQDGSRTFGLFWKEKNPSYNRRNTVTLTVPTIAAADNSLELFFIVYMSKVLQGLLIIHVCMYTCPACMGKLLLMLCCCFTSTVNIMSGRSVNLTTLFLGRLRPPKRLTSTLCTYFRQ